MAHPLTLLTALSLVFPCVAALADSAPLRDPTRPPSEWERGTESSSGAAALIESVVVRRAGKTTAYVNGARYAVGERVGEATVVRVSDSEVVLKGREGLQTISMVPNVEKKTTQAAATGGKPTGLVGRKNEKH